MTDDNTDYDVRVLEFLRMVEKRPGHCEPMPIDDADYDKEFPLLEPHEPSTCSKCHGEYNREEFLALSIPKGEVGTWHYNSSNTTFAIRDCQCGHGLARRIG